MPGFIGGLAQGLQGGGFDQALDQFIKERQLRKTAAAMMNANAGAQQPPAAVPGRPDPMQGLAALGGGQPSPSAQPPQAPPFRPGVPPVPGRPDPLAPLPQAQARPQPMPGAPTGQPGAEAPTGMSVDPGMSDPTKEAQSLIMNLWQTTKARNPKADPLTLMDAVHAQIEDIKGVAPITKATMQGQLMYLKEMSLDQYRNQRLQQYDHDWMIKYQNAKTAEERLALNAQYQRGRLAIQQEHEDSYSENIGYQHEDRQASTGARLSIARENNQTKLQGIDTLEGGRNTRLQQILSGAKGRAAMAAASRVLSYQPNIDGNALADTIIGMYGRDATGGGGGGTKKPATVNSPDDIRKLPSGTPWVSSDGSRHGIAP